MLKVTVLNYFTVIVNNRYLQGFDCTSVDSIVARQSFTQGMKVRIHHMMWLSSFP